MNLKEHINLLEKTDNEISYLGLYKKHEIYYMKNHKYRFEVIIKSIERFPDIKRILDIGTTPFTLFLKKNNSHFEVSTLDLTKLMEKRCTTLGIKFKTCDLTNHHIPFPDNYFDLVIFTEVLEHLFVPPTIVLTKIKRVLRPGGKLILSVPNFATLINRIKLLYGNNPLKPLDETINRERAHGYGHIREYTMKEIIQIVKSCKFIITKKKYIFQSLQRRRENMRARESQLFTVTCYLIASLLPSLQTTIHIECYKPRGQALKKPRVKK